MVKKSKLLAALDAHKGRDYHHEKQKKFQKQAATRKKQLNPPHQSPVTGVGDIGGTKVNNLVTEPEAESDGLGSDESEDATPIAVREPHSKKWIPATVNETQSD